MAYHIQQLQSCILVGGTCRWRTSAAKRTEANQDVNVFALKIGTERSKSSSSNNEIVSTPRKFGA
jgi:hypothetical protein